MRTHGAVVGRRFRSVTKLTTKVRICRGYLWGSFLIAAAALKTPTGNGYNAQGVNLNLHFRSQVGDSMSISGPWGMNELLHLSTHDHAVMCFEFFIIEMPQCDVFSFPFHFCCSQVGDSMAISGPWAMHKLLLSFTHAHAVMFLGVVFQISSLCVCARVPFVS